MVVDLECLSVEKRENGADAKWRPGETVHTAVLLDKDTEHRMAAFLKYSEDDAKTMVVGRTYKFAVTGLGPVKEDKSSYYLRGTVVPNGK